jgi:hypothetical protein
VINDVRITRACRKHIINKLLDQTLKLVPYDSSWIQLRHQYARLEEPDDNDEESADDKKLRTMIVMVRDSIQEWINRVGMYTLIGPKFAQQTYDETLPALTLQRMKAEANLPLMAQDIIDFFISEAKLS